MRTFALLLTAGFTLMFAATAQATPPRFSTPRVIAAPQAMTLPHTTGGYGMSYPRGTYVDRATYGYGYYRPYGTYYGPRTYTYSFNTGALPYGTAVPAYMTPGYLPPRYYGGVGYFGGRGSSYYYGGGTRPVIGIR